MIKDHHGNTINGYDYCDVNGVINGYSEAYPLPNGWSLYVSDNGVYLGMYLTAPAVITETATRCACGGGFGTHRHHLYGHVSNGGSVTIMDKSWAPTHEAFLDYLDNFDYPSDY